MPGVKKNAKMRENWFSPRVGLIGTLETEHV